MSKPSQADAPSAVTVGKSPDRGDKQSDLDVAAAPFLIIGTLTALRSGKLKSSPP